MPVVKVAVPQAAISEVEAKPITNTHEPPPRLIRIWQLPPMLDYEPEQQAIVQALVHNEIRETVQSTGVGYILTKDGWREVQAKPITNGDVQPRQRSVHVMGMGSGRQESKRAKHHKRWSKR